MKEFKFSIKMISQKKETYIVICSVLLINLYHAILLIKPYLADGIIIEWVRSAEEQFILTNNWTLSIRNIIMVVFPILCTLILGDSSWEEKKNNTENILYPRLSTKKLILVRWILSFIIPFFIVFLGLMLNYVTLYLIFGTGHFMVDFPVSSYNFIIPELFLSDFRLNNPSLYIVLGSLHYSVIMGLLSSIAYSYSSYVKQRVFIYFQPLFFMIISSLILSIVGLEKITILSQLLIAANRTVMDSIYVYIILFFISCIPLIFSLRKRDVLA